MASRRETMQHTCHECGHTRRVQFNDRARDRGEHLVTCGGPLGGNRWCYARAKFVLTDNGWQAAA